MNDAAEVVVLAPALMTISNRELLRQQIRAALDARGAAAVVLDLRHTTYVDAAALGMLVNVHRMAKALGMALTLTNVCADVRALLEMARLGEVLTIREAP